MAIKGIARKKSADISASKTMFGAALSQYIDALGGNQSKFAQILSEVQKSFSPENHQAGEKNLQPLVNAWCLGIRSPSKARIGEAAIAIFRWAAISKRLDGNDALSVENPEINGYCLTDVVNHLQREANYAPEAFERDRLWTNKIMSDERKALRIGYVEVPPYASSNPDAASRIFLGIAERALSYLGASIEPTAPCSSWDELTEKLFNREIDVIAPILFESSHYLVKGVRFSESIGLSMPHVALMTPESADSIFFGRAINERRLEPEDLRRLELIRLDAGTSAMLFSQLPGSTRVLNERELSRIAPIAFERDKVAAALEALKDSATDANLFRCVITSTGTANHYEREGYGPFAQIQLPYDWDMPLDFVFGIHPTEDRLCEAINRSVRQMKRLGVIHQLVLRHKDQLKGLVIDRQVSPATTVEHWIKKHERSAP